MRLRKDEKGEWREEEKREESKTTDERKKSEKNRYRNKKRWEENRGNKGYHYVLYVFQCFLFSKNTLKNLKKRNRKL